MINNNLHIVKRQFLELELSDEKKNLEHQNQMKERFFDKIVPVLEEVLDEYSEPEKYYFINSIRIDLGEVNPEDSFEKVVAKFKSELSNKLNTLFSKNKSQSSILSELKNTRDISSESAIKQLAKNQAIVKAFLEYLKKGIFPVWYPVKSYHEFETSLLSIKNELKEEFFEFIKIEKDLSTAFYRLVVIFSEKLIQHLLTIDNELHSFYSNSELKVIYDFIESNRKSIIQVTSKQFWRLIKSQLILVLFEYYKNKVFNIGLLIKQLIKSGPEQQTRLFIVRFIKELEDYLISSNKAANISTKSQSIIESLKNLWQRADKGLQPYDIAQEKNSEDDVTVSIVSLTDILKDEKQSKDLNLRSIDKSETENTKDQEVNIQKKDSLDSEVQVKSTGILKKLFTSDKEMEEDSNYYYVENSGIVLLTPYLEMYFKELGIVNNTGVFVDENAIERAIHNLHFLSFGEIPPIENQLILNKILCGVPVSAPVDCSFKLLSDDMNEAESLLQAVIRNWKALKNTKPDGLREGFFQRSGKISKSNDSWNLIIERKSIDILLNSVPWAYSIVKMPWMKQIIYTEWT